MNPYSAYVQQRMDAQGLQRADVERRGGPSRQQLHKILTDKRERLSRPPSRETVAALAKALDGGNERRLWSAVAEALGLPAGSVSVADVADLTNDDLLAEIARRLRGQSKTISDNDNVRPLRAKSSAQDDEVIGRAAYKPDYPMQADQDPDSQGDAP